MANATLQFLAFKKALEKFANDLQQNFGSKLLAQPEDQLKGPVQALIQATRLGVITKTEAQVKDLGGRPDIGVEVAGALCGHVELKAPGFGAQTKKFKGRDLTQWKKFAALPNVLYTDSSEWALYRSGVHWPKERPVVVRLEEIIERGAGALSDLLVAQMFELLTDFLTWQPVVPTGPKALAAMLAPLCRLLKEDVAAAVADDKSALKRLSAEIREYLFPLSSDEDFADIYAQTLTYALLLARLNGEEHLTATSAAAKLDSGHGLLAETLRILTQPRARAEIETPVALLERVIEAVDPVQLGKRGDPWLYFYEDFLEAYDPQRRKESGVYYTPQDVVGCQTALVAELLDKAFNKPMAFADQGVVFLDSSAGTGAYPLAAIEYALRKVEAELGAGAVAEYATRCAQNMYAFELQVGPYAVAHLRLTKLLTDAGATLPEDGLHVLLTDTLDSPYVDPPIPPLMAERLTQEQRRAKKVKAHVPVFVSMGNPPYFREQGEDPSGNTRGKWVRYGDATDLSRKDQTPERPILRDFVDLAPPVHVKNLYNLYVYFWRWTLWKMFEQPDASRQGIVSFITAASYLRGPGFVGMRQHMREAFDELWIIDLEGDNLGARKTENVFAIQTAVCIAVGVRYAEKKRHDLAKVRYNCIEGTRDEKLTKLKQVRQFSDLAWQDCFQGAQEPFLPQRVGNYFAWPLVTDLWPWQYSGTQWKRTWPVGETPEVLQSRWRALTSAAASERAKLLKETPTCTVKRTALTFDRAIELPSIATAKPDSVAVTSVRYGWRTLDRHWCLPDGRLCDRPRAGLWASQGGSQVFMTSLLSGVLGVGPAASVSAYVPDLHHFRGSFGGRDVIPLWRDAEATQPNLPADLLAELGSQLGVEVSAEDFLAYTYAVLSAPDYVSTFSEELTVPGPRLPITTDVALFRQAVAHGRKLLWLHTYGERFVPADQQPGRIPAGAAKSLKGIPTAADAFPETFSWVAEANHTSQGVLYVGEGRLAPVSRAAYEFSVSGYEVVQSWLAFRMKQRSGRKSSPLDDIRPTVWTADLSQELRQLLWVVEATLAMQPGLNQLLIAILAGQTVAADQLSQPTSNERCAPGDEDDAAQASLI
jgi:hypothetical protein